MVCWIFISFVVILSFIMYIRNELAYKTICRLVRDDNIYTSSYTRLLFQFDCWTYNSFKKKEISRRKV
jgi:hypothetical protein